MFPLDPNLNLASRPSRGLTDNDRLWQFVTASQQVQLPLGDSQVMSEILSRQKHRQVSCCLCHLLPLTSTGAALARMAYWRSKRGVLLARIFFPREFSAKTTSGADLLYRGPDFGPGISKSALFPAIQGNVSSPCGVSKSPQEHWFAVFSRAFCVMRCS
jgi:hypothetical protein